MCVCRSLLVIVSSAGTALAVPGPAGAAVTWGAPGGLGGPRPVNGYIRPNAISQPLVLSGGGWCSMTV